MEYPQARLATVLIAAVIFVLRVPSYVVHPQFVAEDGILWLQAYIYGLESLFLPFVGYLSVAPRLIALAALPFPESYAPAICFYGTAAVDLFIVWLLTSPRLDLPFKPLIALAVFSTGQASHIIGIAFSAVQWVVPFGAIALLLMRPSNRQAIFVLEIMFLAVVGLTGPFAIFYALPFVIQAWLLRNDQAQSKRMAIFAVVVAGCAALQVLTVFTNLEASLQASRRAEFDPLARWAWAELTNMAMQYIFMPVGQYVFNGFNGFVAGLFVTSATITLLMLYIFRSSRYRAHLIYMLMFAGGVLVSGSIKVGPQERYVYHLGVFIIWFLCCLTDEFARTQVRRACVAAIAVLELLFVAHDFRSERHKGEREWSRWASVFRSGLPITVPVGPEGWYLNIPADRNGHLFPMSDWPGKNISAITQVTGTCHGAINSVRRLDEVNYAFVSSRMNSYTGADPRWMAAGSVDPSIDAIVISDQSDRVLGFGVAGLRDGWSAVYPARDDKIKAFGISKDGKVCGFGD